MITNAFITTFALNHKQDGKIHKGYQKVNILQIHIIGMALAFHKETGRRLENI